MMTIRGETPDHDISAPLRTDADVLRRVDFCVSDRSQRALWLLFIGPDEIQLPVVVPVSDIPERPGSDGAMGICTMIAQLMTESADCASAVIALARPGTVTLTDSDRQWCRTLHADAAREGAALRMICLAATDGVRQFTLDDAR
jgi:hypothetical protein